MVTTPAAPASIAPAVSPELPTAIAPTPDLTIQPSNTQLTPNTQKNFGREITNLTKFYTDEVKYSGEQDNFDFKYEIFQNYYLQAGVPK